MHKIDKIKLETLCKSNIFTPCNIWHVIYTRALELQALLSELFSVQLALEHRLQEIQVDDAMGPDQLHSDIRAKTPQSLVAQRHPPMEPKNTIIKILVSVLICRPIFRSFFISKSHSHLDINNLQKTVLTKPMLPCNYKLSHV